MSGKISGAVWEMNLPREEKYVLLAYADHADHEGNGVRPSYDLVAWKTGYKKRRVQQVVAKLEAKQILVVVKPGGNLEAGTLGLPTEWYIDVEAAPKLPRRVQRASPSKKGEGATQDTHMRVQRASPKTSVEPKDSVSSLTNVREETRGDVLAKAIEEHGFKPGDAITQGNTVLGLLTQSERGDNPQLSPVAEQTSSDVLILSPSPAAIPKPPRPELKIVPKPEPLIEVRYCDMLRGPKTFTMHLLDINGPGYFKKSVCGAIDDYEMKNGPTPGIEYVWCEKCQAAHSADPAELVNVPPESPLPPGWTLAKERGSHHPRQPRSGCWIVDLNRKLVYLKRFKKRAEAEDSDLYKTLYGFCNVQSGQSIWQSCGWYGIMEPIEPPKRERKPTPLTPLQLAVGSHLLKQPNDATIDANKSRVNKLQRAILTCEAYAAGQMPTVVQSYLLADGLVLDFIPWYLAEFRKRFNKDGDVPSGEDTLPKWYGEWIGLGRPGQPGSIPLGLTPAKLSDPACPDCGGTGLVDWFQGGGGPPRKAQPGELVSYSTECKCGKGKAV